MKKLACILLLFMVAILFWLRPKVSEPGEVKLLAPEVPPESMASDARATQRAAPGPVVAHSSSVDIVWLELLLEEHPTPQKIEALAHEQRLSVAQTIQGHPKSGQRLEMRWGSSPATTAVFDILGQDKYALSAVRSLYPADTSWENLKAGLKDKIKRPIQHEDDKSLIFASNAQGLTVWLARNEDGTFKVAAEFGAHTHESPR